MKSWQSYLKEYKNYLKLERGLSSNTIDNYGLDVEKLMLYLEDIKLGDCFISREYEMTLEEIKQLAALKSPAKTVEQIDAILKTRRNLAQNAAPLLLVEALMCELR